MQTYAISRPDVFCILCQHADTSSNLEQEHRLTHVLLLGAAGSSSGNSANAFGLSVPFARMGLSESEGRAVGLHNSPVNGLLYVRGNVGEPSQRLVIARLEGLGFRV